METYLDFNIRKWNGVWKGEGTALVNRDFSEEEFEDLRNEREQDGYKLVDIETYTELDGTRKWAGVWESANEDEHFQMDRTCANSSDSFTTFTNATYLTAGSRKNYSILKPYHSP
ncbi:MAG: hypothetical protein IPG32_16390 [Saprospirales bacterium]|nr:hypothetical protein [Saprospirales bacterium]